ncbi:MAG: OmpA family protein [Xanthomonadales bacterium]|nr:OmpA family protein [Xanthomonadales bacterium]
MKILRMMTLAGVLVLAACSSVPERVDLLEEARIKVEAVDRDPMAEQVAGAELRQAKAALNEAERRHGERDDLELIRHDAYRALRHAEIAEQRIAEERAREAIVESEERRQAMVLAAREREADAARRAAEREARAAEHARAVAEARDREATLRAEEARLARLEAEERQREAQVARDEAARNRAEAEAARSEAQMARDDAARSEAEAAQARLEAEAARAQAASLEARLLEMEAEETERGLVLTLDDVLFDTDGDSIKPGAQQTLKRLAELLDDHQDRNILIEGHTDAQGDAAYNQQLSERRASSVREALIAAGVSADRIRVEGRGEHYPVATNDTPEGRQQNRRVEIIISDEEGQFVFES